MTKILSKMAALNKKPIGVKELVVAKGTLLHVYGTGQTSCTAKTDSNIDPKGLLICEFKIDNELQVVVPQQLKPRVPYREEYPMLAGNPGGKKLYDTLRGKYIGAIWPATFFKRYRIPIVRVIACNAISDTETATTVSRPGHSNSLEKTYWNRFHKQKRDKKTS